MAATTDEGLVIVTGASGHIGREVCRILRAAGKKILPVDVNPDTREDVIACDLRSKNEVSRLFQSHPVQTVVHLAAILPSAFQSDPLVGAEVNLSGCFELMRQAVNCRIKRFIFASSMSVYGSRSAKTSCRTSWTDSCQWTRLRVYIPTHRQGDRTGN